MSAIGNQETVEEVISKLAERASACTACGLALKRRTVVFGEGNPRSPLVLVGEGPGEQEDRTGRPFVGPAGQILDRALLDNGLDRNDVYICNVVKCRAADWQGEHATNRPPSTDEIQSCSQWLIPQLSAIAPKVILCVGAPSANALIQKGFQLTKDRGKLFPCRYARYAIATLHPAYILRQRGKESDGGYSLLVQDVALAYTVATSIE